MPVNDGGPAFPADAQVDPARGLSAGLLLPASQGMSQRDWFAGQALAGAIAHHGPLPLQYADIAKTAYAQADAMLVARTPPTQQGSE